MPDPIQKPPGDRIDSLLAEMSVGAAGGFISGGPVGGAIGASVPLAQRLFVPVLREFRERVLGQREALRVASVAEMAVEKIARDLREGCVPRDDGFFDRDGDNRPEAEELLEGVLLAAQREHEERKLPYYACLLANLVFEPNADSITANWLVRIAEDLTYTQLVLLAVVEGKHDVALPDNSRAASVSWRSASVRAELDDLGFAAKELVLPEPQQGRRRLSTNIGSPQDLVLTQYGKAIFGLMGLSGVDRDDRLNTVDALWSYSGLERNG